MEKTFIQIELELAGLFKKKELLDREITRLVNQRDRIKDQEYSNYIKAIPSDLNKITPKQWHWIFEAGHHINSSIRYDFCSKVIESLGLNESGFWCENSQTGLYISQYGFDAVKVKVGFKLIKRHLIPVTIKGHFTTETGIRLSVHGLTEDYTSILYVHKDGTVALYKEKYLDPRPFKNFNQFIDWYTLEKKED
jgi:hypothetical protein